MITLLFRTDSGTFGWGKHPWGLLNPEIKLPRFDIIDEGFPHLVALEGHPADLLVGLLRVGAEEVVVCGGRGVGGAEGGSQDVSATEILPGERYEV